MTIGSEATVIFVTFAHQVTAHSKPIHSSFTEFITPNLSLFISSALETRQNQATNTPFGRETQFATAQLSANMVAICRFAASHDLRRRLAGRESSPWPRLPEA